LCSDAAVVLQSRTHPFPNGVFTLEPTSIGDDNSGAVVVVVGGGDDVVAGVMNIYYYDLFRLANLIMKERDRRTVLYGTAMPCEKQGYSLLAPFLVR